MLCETRWVERHSNLVDFRKMLIPILSCLEEVVGGDQWDSKSRTDAQGLLSSLTSSSFIASFSSHYYVMGHTKQLSILLQGVVASKFAVCYRLLKSFPVMLCYFLFNSNVIGLNLQVNRMTFSRHMVTSLRYKR